MIFYKYDYSKKGAETQPIEKIIQKKSSTFFSAGFGARLGGAAGENAAVNREKAKAKDG